MFTLILRDIDERQQAEERLEQLQRQNLYLQEELKSELNFEELVGTCSVIQKVFRSIEMVAETDSTVLLMGETGTGKELIARALHNRSRRRQNVMVKVNCAALPASLVESELFGHEKGAFTGAVSQKKGRFEVAHQGTIFLDEVGELPLETQTKLLRVLAGAGIRTPRRSRNVESGCACDRGYQSNSWRRKCIADRSARISTTV